MRQWTPEERERQSALIRQWKPWERSTGPRTEAGKATASGNAQSHGMRSADWIAEQRRIIDIIQEFKESAIGI